MLLRKLMVTILMLALMALAFGRVFGQENAPYHMAYCPAPAICCPSQASVSQGSI